MPIGIDEGHRIGMHVYAALTGSPVKTEPRPWTREMRLTYEALVSVLEDNPYLSEIERGAIIDAVHKTVHRRIANLKAAISLTDKLRDVLHCLK